MVNAHVLMLGDLVFGVVAAPYGGYMTAALDTWKTVTPDQWRFLAPVPLPDPGVDLDINYWALESTPGLGGSAFYYEGESRLTCVRLSPPPEGPHVYHQLRRDEAERKKRGNPPPQHGQPPAERPPSRRRENRGRSLVRYTRFRVGRNEWITRRGRRPED